MFIKKTLFFKEKTNKDIDIYGENTLFGTKLVTFSDEVIVQSQPMVGLHDESPTKLAMYPELVLYEGKNVYFIAENSEKNSFRLVKTIFK